MKEKKKQENFVWAVTELKKLIENNHFGSATFNIQNGIIDKLKTDTYSIPCIDESKKNN